MTPTEHDDAVTTPVDLHDRARDGLPERRTQTYDAPPEEVARIVRRTRPAQ